MLWFSFGYPQLNIKQSVHYSYRVTENGVLLIDSIVRLQEWLIGSFNNIPVHLSESA